MNSFFGAIQSNINRNHPNYADQTEKLINRIRSIADSFVARHTLEIKTELSLIG